MTRRDNKRLKGDKLRSSAYKGVDRIYADRSSFYDPEITKSDDMFLRRSSFKTFYNNYFNTHTHDVVTSALHKKEEMSDV